MSAEKVRLHFIALHEDGTVDTAEWECKSSVKEDVALTLGALIGEPIRHEERTNLRKDEYGNHVYKLFTNN